jgi:hypothetical protein
MCTRAVALRLSRCVDSACQITHRASRFVRDKHYDYERESLSSAARFTSTSFIPAEVNYCDRKQVKSLSDPPQRYSDAISWVHPHTSCKSTTICWKLCYQRTLLTSPVKLAISQLRSRQHSDGGATADGTVRSIGAPTGGKQV